MGSSGTRGHVRPLGDARGNPAVRLVVRKMQFASPRAWCGDSSPLAAALDAALSSPPMIVRPSRGRKKKVGGWGELTQWICEVGPAVYQIEPEDSPVPFKLTINATDVSVGFECEIPIDGDSIEAPRTRMRTLLTGVHSAHCRDADIGPILAITLRNVPYRRPTPPTEDPQWPAGAVTLAACQRFWTSKQPEKRRTFEILRAQELARGLKRDVSEDLLLIETESSDLGELGEQRYWLEKWMGETLKLRRNEDFLESGDKRIAIWERQRAEGLGFYDSASKVLYKGVAELEDDELDAETLKLLDTILNLNKLPDGREVHGKRVVFVGRPAALRWLPWVRERGGSVAYLGDNNELWDPAPDTGTD
jgi:hypothetical protein